MIAKNGIIEAKSLDFVRDKDRPNEGELHMISIVD